MSGNGHLSPAQVHAKVKHPIVDGDGHWVEFPPVFAEKMRKVGGDKAADGGDPRGIAFRHCRDRSSAAGRWARAGGLARDPRNGR